MEHAARDLNIPLARGGRRDDRRRGARARGHGVHRGAGGDVPGAGGGPDAHGAAGARHALLLE
jgi:hypothetical protein